MSAEGLSEKTISIPKASGGIPLIGNTLEMAKDPAAFFLRCYRDHGAVYQINVFGRKSYVIAGVEAAKFMTQKSKREMLRSKEFWEDFRIHMGASKLLTGLDGAEHQKMRSIMRDGFSPRALEGRYGDAVGLADKALDRDWLSKDDVEVVEACQFMIVQILGDLMSGKAPIEYVRDIRLNILFILNVLVTRQRPKFFLKFPSFKRAQARVNEMGREMIGDFKERTKAGKLPDNLLGDIMRAHGEDPEFIQERDLQLLLTGPYVAGLDTVANTLAACVYGILKTPGVLEKVQQEADELYAKESIGEEDIAGLDYIHGCIKEAMRLWPIAVAQMRVTTQDVEFEGHVIPEGEMIYIGTSVPHFMEEYFPDPQKFDPERSAPERREHMKPGVYAPFGRGPHTCLGKNLAELLMAIAISRMFHRADLQLDPPDYVLKTKSAPTPGPAMSFKIKVAGERNSKKEILAEKEVA